MLQVSATRDGGRALEAHAKTLEADAKAIEKSGSFKNASSAGEHWFNTNET